MAAAHNENHGNRLLRQPARQPWTIATAVLVAQIFISSDHKNGQDDGLFDHIIVAMEAAVARQWRQQDNQFERYNE